MTRFSFPMGLKEVEEMTPKKGFNVCTFDDFAPAGEKLTLIERTETFEEALKISKDLEKEGEKCYIYGGN